VSKLTNITANSNYTLPDLCTMSAVFFVVLVGELLAVVLSVAETGLRHFSWNVFAMVSLYTLWVILLSVGLLCNLRPWLQRFSGPGLAGLSYTLVLMVALIVSTVSQTLLNPVADSLDFMQIGSEVLIAAVVAGIAGRYFFVQQQLRDQQKAELTARLEALQARIRPHFLFNSMNSIASLISVDADAAENLVLDLSDLFRASMSDKLQVQLVEEIGFGRRYLRIEQARIAGRLKVDWQLDKECDSVLLPALILQPLLENAVYHGVQLIPEGGEVGVLVERVGNNCRIRITNPVPTNGKSQQGNQMALNNIRYRIEAIYGGKAQFSAQQQGREFIAELIIPMGVKDRLSKVGGRND
jgi:two-component system sensor histidine kinase AlgZ